MYRESFEKWLVGAELRITESEERIRRQLLVLKDRQRLNFRVDAAINELNQLIKALHLFRAERDRLLRFINRSVAA